VEAGLSASEVTQRRSEFGLNDLTPPHGQNVFLRFFEQFNQPIQYILLVAALVTALFKDWIDAGVILAVALLNAFIGFFQEFRAENAIAALAKVVTTETTVIRDGQKQRIPSIQLVPGDLVLLSAGDKVPADLRLVEVFDFQVSEAGLTGESAPVEKITQPVEEETNLAERLNMAYAGSLVTAGQASGLVVAIADQTETGRISQLMQRTSNLVTPLTRKIQKFSRTLLYWVLFFAAVTFTVGIGQGDNSVEVFKAAVALAVSAVPEGLPTVMTITLAIGVSRMAERHAIIRKLPAVETLGSATVICSDKTGTLTENQMTVEEIYADGRSYVVSGVGYNPDGNILFNKQQVNLSENPALQECLLTGILCNDSHVQEVDGNWQVIGDPTEGALIVSAKKAGLDQEVLEDAIPRLDVIPFDSKSQYMATLHERDSSAFVYMKGSLEAVLGRCQQMFFELQFMPLDTQLLKSQAEEMAKRGLRVLAFAKKEVETATESLDTVNVDQDFVFLGLQGMIDPPRPEAIAAVRACQDAGIQVKMITGDHPDTANAIARQIGIIQQDSKVLPLTGRDIARIDDNELASAAVQTSVFARVAPEQKLRLVEILQTKGEIVAMTGDGVNDAPALKQADIGIAMGTAGTEVAKEAADMLLTDDNFASIAAAVEEGRTVYRNLQRAISFILPISAGEAMTIFLGVLFGDQAPIVPVQILWVNMVSAISLTVPLAFEPKTSKVMQQPPRNPREPLLSRSLSLRILVISLWNAIVTFGAFEWVLATTKNLDLARTVAVNALVSTEIFYLLSISRFVPSVVARLRGNSRPIGFAPAIGIICLTVLQILFSQWSVMNQLFDTTPLNLTMGLLCVSLGLPIIIVAQVMRLLAPMK
jgi:Ca2+-transporting ATPase